MCWYNNLSSRVFCSPAKYVDIKTYWAKLGQHIKKVSFNLISVYTINLTFEQSTQCLHKSKYTRSATIMWCWHNWILFASLCCEHYCTQAHGIPRLHITKLPITPQSFRACITLNLLYSRQRWEQQRILIRNKKIHVNLTHYCNLCLFLQCQRYTFFICFKSTLTKSLTVTCYLKECNNLNKVMLT